MKSVMGDPDASTSAIPIGSPQSMEMIWNVQLNDVVSGDTGVLQYTMLSGFAAVFSIAPLASTVNIDSSFDVNPWLKSEYPMPPPFPATKNRKFGMRPPAAVLLNCVKNASKTPR